MRIVVWNCNVDALDEMLEPDVVVVSEAANPERLHKQLTTRSLHYAWTGRLPTKGLGVLGYRGLEVTPIRDVKARIEFALPVNARRSDLAFNVLAVWAMNRRAQNVYPIDVERRQAQQAVLRYADLLQERPSVVAGDFNNHVRWDKPGKPSNMRNAEALLAERGFVSAYHHWLGVDLGDEPAPTHYWQTRSENGRTYHIDYCFIPTTWAERITSVRLGTYADWVGSGLSDHVPLVVDLDV
jgi:exodeoxyribonuclease-3